MSACPVQPGAPEIYIVKPILKRQRVARGLRPVAARLSNSKKKRFCTGVFRVLDYVWDGLTAIRHEHARRDSSLAWDVARGAKGRQMQPQYPSVWDWIGEIAEVYFVEHCEQTLGITVKEFVERRQAAGGTGARRLRDLRKARRQVIPHRCAECGRVSVELGELENA
jgi:hypothetical protein